ncbi:hypothetical protein N656DRAFT_388507 [Canariomyces notabilis]|uniref:C2H2-type domain-containing protein n=1 Tax=Canariomyces notabilis TaxID=2074819 RepID=A0AAN6TJR9_9PEZI|nr:hypothetical protein N656DRAFT_388507 [Canariomyces arenarius]
MTTMDLTPPALTRSPSSPANTYCPSERSSLDYPSPGLVEQQYKLSSIYGDQSCAVTPPMDHETSLPPLDSMGHHDWNSTTVIHPVSSASGMPNILSSEYDTFGNYSYTHDVYHAHSASHAPSIHASTPPPTGSAPRSSPAPSRTSIPYTPAPSVPGSLTPRLKMEGSSEYSQCMDGHYPSPRSVQTSFASDSGAYASTSGGYLSDSGSTTWHKPEFQPVEPEPFYPQPSAYLHDARRQYRITRPRRAPRRLTTKEEANFQCEVKGCGKLFSRSYNFKAHMETHDEKREYPFPCPVNDCNKKFVRKTDLQRHHQSVHMRERNHKCDYCGRMFARKDTLRRHMEDGCSKRFDIGTLDLRAESYDSMHPGARPMGPLGHMIPPPGGLPPMAIPPLCSTSVLGSMAPSMRPREAIAAGDHSHAHSWGR